MNVAIEGIVPALLTALDRNGEIDERALRRLAKYQVDAGVGGFFVCGSAGEGVYMTPEERRRVLEIVADEVGDRVPLIAHVGAMSTAEAVQLARDARAAGAKAVSSMPPLVFRQPWPSVIAHIRAIAEASELPTYYYHLPGITNVQITADEVEAMAEAIPTLIGLKYSSPDLFLLWEVINLPGRHLETLYGCDQQLVQGLLTGANGGIGSTYNYQIEFVVELYHAFRHNDIARARQMQDKVNRVIQVLFKHGGSRATEKAMMTLRGFEVGPPRKPCQPFPEERMAALKRDMEAVGLFQA